jgi:hypothetical protein
MSTKTRIFIPLLILIVVIVGSIWLGYELKQLKLETESSVNNTETSVVFNEMIAVSPDGKYVATVNKTASGQSQELKVTSVTGNDEHILSTKDLSYTFQHPIWNSSGNRLYFAYTRKDPSVQTTLFYIDLSNPDPYAVTEIVYTDIQGLLNGSAEIAGENGNLLYINNGTKLYQIDLDKGIDASPILLFST